MLVAFPFSDLLLVLQHSAAEWGATTMLYPHAARRDRVRLRVPLLLGTGFELGSPRGLGGLGIATRW